MLKKWLRSGLMSVGALVLAGSFSGCSSPVNSNPETQDFPNDLSEGRKAIAKVVDSADEVSVDLLQLTDPSKQNRAYPLGKTQKDPNDPNKTITVYSPWTSKFGGAKKVNLGGFGYEFDRIAKSTVKKETDYILGMATDPYSPDPNGTYTAVGINLSAVNPFVYTHDPNSEHYYFYEAMYPSNDDQAEDRSMFDLSKGDVAIMVKGIRFWKDYNDHSIYNGKTRAVITGMGDTARLLYMRDNAFMSGRFFNLPGVAPKGPAMGYQTPDKIYYFNSAQVNGPGMTQYTIPAVFTSLSDLRVCPEDPNQVPVNTFYSFLDLSNQDPNGVAADGYGGFLLVIREEAFKGNYAKVVVIIMEGLSQQGIDIERINKEVESIYAQIKEIRIGYKKSMLPPPR
jgi:hypothetical protein